MNIAPATRDSIHNKRNLFAEQFENALVDIYHEGQNSSVHDQTETLKDELNKTKTELKDKNKLVLQLQTDLQSSDMLKVQLEHKERDLTHQKQLVQTISLGKDEAVRGLQKRENELVSELQAFKLQHEISTRKMTEDSAALKRELDRVNFKLEEAHTHKQQIVDAQVAKERAALQEQLQKTKDDYDRSWYQRMNADIQRLKVEREKCESQLKLHHKEMLETITTGQRLDETEKQRRALEAKLNDTIVNHQKELHVQTMCLEKLKAEAEQHQRVLDANLNETKAIHQNELYAQTICLEKVKAEAALTSKTLEMKIRSEVMRDEAAKKELEDAKRLLQLEQFVQQKAQLEQQVATHHKTIESLRVFEARFNEEQKKKLAPAPKGTLYEHYVQEFLENSLGTFATVKNVSKDGNGHKGDLHVSFDYPAPVLIMIDAKYREPRKNADGKDMMVKVEGQEFEKFDKAIDCTRPDGAIMFSNVYAVKQNRRRLSNMDWSQRGETIIMYVSNEQFGTLVQSILLIVCEVYIKKKNKEMQMKIDGIPDVKQLMFKLMNIIKYQQAQLISHGKLCDEFEKQWPAEHKETSEAFQRAHEVLQKEATLKDIVDVATLEKWKSLSIQQQRGRPVQSLDKKAQRAKMTTKKRLPEEALEENPTKRRKIEIDDKKTEQTPKTNETKELPDAKEIKQTKDLYRFNGGILTIEPKNTTEHLQELQARMNAMNVFLKRMFPNYRIQIEGIPDHYRYSCCFFYKHKSFTKAGITKQLELSFPKVFSLIIHPTFGYKAYQQHLLNLKQQHHQIGTFVEIRDGIPVPT